MLKITERNLRILIRECLEDELLNESIISTIGGYITDLLTPNKVAQIQEIAESTADSLFPHQDEHLTRKKAFRHMYACALLTISLGPHLARFIGYLNEIKGAIRVTIKTFGKKFHSGLYMDIPNNDAGIEIGLLALKKFKNLLNKPPAFYESAKNYIYEVVKKKADLGDFFVTDKTSGKTKKYSLSPTYMATKEPEKQIKSAALTKKTAIPKGV